MKNIVKIFVISMTLLSMGCEQFLTVNPQDSLVKENYYNSAEAVRANTATLYDYVWWDFQNRFMWMGGDMMAGDLHYTYGDEGQFYLNTVTDNNQYSNNGWTGLYNVISYANSVMLDMPEAARLNGVSDDVINKALGEAYLFRAVAYYFLTEYWHEVPIIDNAEALITSGNVQDIYVPKATQRSLYRFICEDLEKAVELLPENDNEPGRVNKWSAKGMLAKVYLTRAVYEKNHGGYEGDSNDYFELAKQTAKEVITMGPALYPNFSEMFEIEAENISESLIAIQCITGGYGYGNNRSIEWGRNGTITGASCWGAGKSPTVSLQEAFEEHPEDGRRMWTYMQQGDVYPSLAVGESDYYGNGEVDYSNGYVYRNTSMDLSTEAPNEGLAHIKKYIINAHGGVNIGTMQDGSNNLYLLRVADVYFVYAEACLRGDLNATLTDPEALGYVNQVLNRGGDSDAGYTVESLTYLELIKERRKEFAFEGMNWLDIQRLYYLDVNVALDYMNKMYRDKVYVFNWEKYALDYPDATDANQYDAMNKREYYVRQWYTRVDQEVYTDVGVGEDVDTSNRAAAIVLSEKNFTVAIPADVMTKAPILNSPAVDYYAE
ncbi:MAG: RagB/SusD family nutrient uptake outer membrane protein [Alistipes sp.]|nr:RagB/SusD family nutrient uptake outer membrane protein [Alistipes sp.]